MLILVSGWKNSGKDTVANYLKNAHNFKQLSFAGSLKDSVSEEFKIPREWLDCRERKEKPLPNYPVSSSDSFSKEIHNLLKDEFRRIDGSLPSTIGHGLYWTPRSLCILKGSTNRSVSSSYWVDMVIGQCSVENNLVISDFRYSSEYNNIRQQLNIPTYTLRVNRFKTINTSDPSERDLDNFNFDFTINNTGTLEELYAKIEDVLKEIV